MAKRNWGLCVFAAAMAFSLSIAGIACILTAFEVECDLATVLLWCMMSAIVWSVCLTVEKTLIPAAISALIIGYIWRSGILQDGVNGFAYSITYGLKGREGTADSVLCLLAAAGCMNTAFAICKRKGGFLAIFFAVVPLIPCFLDHTSTPSALWLGIWLFCVTLLLLTQPARKQGSTKKLIAVLILPVAVLSIVLLLLLPQNKQEKPRAFARQTVQFLQEIGIGVPEGRPLKVDGGAMELRKLGPRQEANYPVMTVKSDLGGVLYLRGCAYDTYFQNNWTNLNLREEDLYWPRQLQTAGTVTIKTEYAMSMRYFPYYVSGDGLSGVTRGINNFSKQTEYSYEVGVLNDRPDSYTNAPTHGYTQLPTVAQRWADSVLTELIEPGMTDAEKLAAITQYVKNLAKYSLYADKMPGDAADFVVWFAEEADQGYCVHFASAAAVLLRGAGIPSRFVTGYMVQTKAGQETQVYGKDAHAWVECFLEGVGWIPVEATPGAEPEQVTQPVKTAQKPLNATPVLYGGAALLVGLAGFMVLRWIVNVLRRRRRRKKGTDRERILHIYSQLAELLRLSDEAPPEELRQIAERARFSDHPVEADSCEKLEIAFKNAKKSIKKHALIRRIQYRLILNLY